MKILFDNVLERGEFASVNASANYPARNLADGFLRLRYQANAASDSVTITLAEITAIDSIYLGYTGNLASITVALYNGGELQTVALGAIHVVSTGGARRIFEPGVTKHFGAGEVDYFDDYGGEQFASRHFPLVFADEIVLTFTGANPFYIGGIGAGLAEDIPPAVAAWDDEFVDESVVVRSAHGQVQQQYIEPRDAFTFSFTDVPFADFYRVKEACASVASKPVWVTFFEDSETTFPPGYFSVTMEGQQRERLAYGFSLSFEEAR